MVVEKAFKTRYTHEHQKKHPQRLAGAVKPNAAQPNNKNQSDSKYKSIQTHCSQQVLWIIFELFYLIKMADKATRGKKMIDSFIFRWSEKINAEQK